MLSLLGLTPRERVLAEAVNARLKTYHGTVTPECYQQALEIQRELDRVDRVAKREKEREAAN